MTIKSLIITLLLTGTSVAHASWPLSESEANHVVEFQFNPKEDGAKNTLRKTTLGEILGDDSKTAIVESIRRCARAIARHRQVDPFRGGSPLTKIDLVYADEGAGVNSVWFSTSGLRPGNPNTERVATAFIANSGRIRSLYFAPGTALPEFQLTAAEAETPDKAHSMFITLLSELGIIYSAHETEVVKLRVPEKNRLTILHREPLAGLLYGSGNGIEAFFERWDIDGSGNQNSPNMALTTLRFSYARPYIAPTQPIPSVAVQRQRAVDVLRQRFDGIEDVTLLPFAPSLSGIPSDEDRDPRMNASLSARHRNIRAQNLSIVTNVVRAFVTHSSNPAALGQWGMTFDSQTGELLHFRRLTDGPGSPMRLSPIDLAQPMTLDGKEVSLQWRKPFLTPSGEPHWLSQGNNVRRVYWNEAFQLWMMREGDHSLVARML